VRATWTTCPTSHTALPSIHAPRSACWFDLRGGEPSAAATVPVARASALVAVKTRDQRRNRRRRDYRKVGSDAFDVVRLLQRWGPDAIGSELTSLAQPELVSEIRRLAERHLVEEADRTAASIIRSAVQGVMAVGADQIELLVGPWPRDWRHHREARPVRSPFRVRIVERLPESDRDP